MKEKICALLFFVICLLSFCACGRIAVSDNFGYIQDFFSAEDSAERVEKEEIKMNKNAEGKQIGHEKRFEGGSVKEVSESIQ